MYSIAWTSSRDRRGVLRGDAAARIREDARLLCCIRFDTLRLDGQTHQLARIVTRRHLRAPQLPEGR